MEAALNTLKLSAFLLLGLLSCTSPKPPPPAAKATVNPPTAKEAVDPDLTPPQTVRSERVQNDNRGVKTLTLENAEGHYVVSCNVKETTCITPMPGKDYYLFTKTTKWKFPGAKDYVTLEWLEGWSGTYNNEETVALLPLQGDRTAIGVYWLKSWEDKKQFQQ